MVASVEFPQTGPCDRKVISFSSKISLPVLISTQELSGDFPRNPFTKLCAARCLFKEQSEVFVPLALVPAYPRSRLSRKSKISINPVPREAREQKNLVQEEVSTFFFHSRKLTERISYPREHILLAKLGRTHTTQCVFSRSGETKRRSKIGRCRTS